MAKIARHQHTVPKFYLQQFARTNRLQVYDRVELREFSQSTRDASVVNHIYTLPRKLGYDPQILERSFAEVESTAAKSLLSVSNGFQLTNEDKVELAKFFAIQLKRTTLLHDSHLQLAQAARSKQFVKQWVYERRD